MLRVITEDGYRDLTKYGFRKIDSHLRKSTYWFEQIIEQDDYSGLAIVCSVHPENWQLEFNIYEDDCDMSYYDSSFTDLDFLYDMIKDGILEKVE